MNDRPFFSVVVPAYNQARYLPAALDSVLAQVDSDWECVVVNDGSKDETGAVADAYAGRDARFRVFHKDNGGAATALNLGIREARGEWICWLSSDDMFKPQKLAKHRDWISRKPGCDFFFGEFQSLIDETGEVGPGHMMVPFPATFELPVLSTLECGFVNGITTCVRRRAFDAVGLFDPGSWYGQDYDMFLRLFCHGPATFVPGSECLYRQHAAQDTATRHHECLFDMARAGILFLNRHPLPDMLPRIDWDNEEAVSGMIHRAMDVAMNQYSYCYALGAHSALIGRIMEWLWQDGKCPMRRRLRAVFGQRARAAVHTLTDPVLAAHWRAAATVAGAARRAVAFTPVDVNSLVASRCRHEAGRNAARSERLKAYYVRLGGEASALHGDDNAAVEETALLVDGSGGLSERAEWAATGGPVLHFADRRTAVFLDRGTTALGTIGCWPCMRLPRLAGVLVGLATGTYDRLCMREGEPGMIGLLADRSSGPGAGAMRWLLRILLRTRRCVPRGL